MYRRRWQPRLGTHSFLARVYWYVAPAGTPGPLAPELDPDSELGPELPVEPDPMPGQWPFPFAPGFGGVPDFCAGAGVVGGGVVGVVVVGVVDCVVVAALFVLGAAAAPAMPATAPVVAIAPATIVAPSIFEMVIGRPPGSVGCV